MKKIMFLFVLILSAGGAFAGPGAPAARTLRGGVDQAPDDARFAGWLGCWRLDDDLSGTGARMCITPEKNGVRLQTVVGANKGIDEVVIADGVTRPIADAECKGNEQAEWSADGARVFRTTNVTCGKEAPRTIKTVAFLAPGPAWVMVQHVWGESATANLRVQRYRRAVNQNLADGSRAPQPELTSASRVTAEQARWSIEDVIEASGKLPIEAIQAALTELHHGFDLNRKTLVALDQGGVHESVIDLMIALTYPKKFVVERAGGSAPMGISTGTGWFDPFMPAEFAMNYGNCYTPYGYGYRSYYNMCGPGFYPSTYNYYGYGYPSYPIYGTGGDWIGIGTTPPVIGTIEPQPDGRVVNGRGYTQIRDRQAEPSPRINGNSNGSGWSGSGSSGASSGGYSSGSSSSGSSGGSGGDSGARVAVPKGGGQ